MICLGCDNFTFSDGREFDHWVFAGGRKLAGLVRRRATERGCSKVLLFQGNSLVRYDPNG